jgi:hypothetical protein
VRYLRTHTSTSALLPQRYPGIASTGSHAWMQGRSFARPPACLHCIAAPSLHLNALFQPRSPPSLNQSTPLPTAAPHIKSDPLAWPPLEVAQVQHDRQVRIDAKLPPSCLHLNKHVLTDIRTRPSSDMQAHAAASTILRS